MLCGRIGGGRREPAVTDDNDGGLFGGIGDCFDADARLQALSVVGTAEALLRDPRFELARGEHRLEITEDECDRARISRGDLRLDRQAAEVGAIGGHGIQLGHRVLAAAADEGAGLTDVERVAESFDDGGRDGFVILVRHDDLVRRARRRAAAFDADNLHVRQRIVGTAVAFERRAHVAHIHRVDERELGSRAAGELDVEDPALLEVVREQADADDDQDCTHAAERRGEPHPVDFGRQQRVPLRERPRNAAEVLELELVDEQAEDRAGDVECREERGKDADQQCQAKAFDFFAAEDVEQQRGDAGGDVRVEDGAEGAVVGVAERLPDAESAVLFFAKSLEDEDVGIDAHAEREDDAGNAREREGCLQGGHAREDDEHVHQHRREGHDAAEVVVADEEDADDDEAGDAGDEAGLQVVAAQLRADGAFADRLFAQPRGQRAGVERADEVLLLADAESALAAGDNAGAADGAVEVGRADDLVIEHDRQRAADVGTGELAEEVRAGRIELEADGAEAVVAGDAGLRQAPLPVAGVEAAVVGVVDEDVVVAVGGGFGAGHFARPLRQEPPQLVARPRPGAGGIEPTLHLEVLRIVAAQVVGDDVELQQATAAEQPLERGRVGDFVANLLVRASRIDVLPQGLVTLRKRAVGELAETGLSKLVVLEPGQSLGLLCGDVRRGQLRLGGFVGLACLGLGDDGAVAGGLQCVVGIGDGLIDRTPRLTATGQRVELPVAVVPGAGLDCPYDLGRRRDELAQAAFGLLVGVTRRLALGSVAAEGHLDFKPRLSLRPPDEAAGAVGIDTLFQRGRDAFGERCLAGPGAAFGAFDLVEQTGPADHVDALAEVVLHRNFPAGERLEEAEGSPRVDRADGAVEHREDEQDAAGVGSGHEKRVAEVAHGAAGRKP